MQGVAMKETWRKNKKRDEQDENHKKNKRYGRKPYSNQHKWWTMAWMALDTTWWTL